MKPLRIRIVGWGRPRPDLPPRRLHLRERLGDDRPAGSYGKPRPALIIQSDLFDEHPSVTILPVTGELRDAAVSGYGRAGRRQRSAQALAGDGRQGANRAAREGRRALRTSGRRDDAGGYSGIGGVLGIRLTRAARRPHSPAKLRPSPDCRRDDGAVLLSSGLSETRSKEAEPAPRCGREEAVPCVRWPRDSASGGSTTSRIATSAHLLPVLRRAPAATHGPRAGSRRRT